MKEIPELLKLAISQGASVRLENALRHAYTRGALRIHTREEYLRKAVDGVPHDFLHIPNLGKKSLAELDAMVRCCAIDPPPVIPQSSAVNVSHHAALPKSLSEPASDDPVDLTQILLKCLNEREQLVLRKRYGLEGAARSTLEEVGNQLGVTRERIRQIEGKAFRKLRAQAAQLALNRFLESQKSAILTHLFEEFLWFSASHVNVAKSKLSGEAQLAIDASFGSTEAWLDKYATTFHQGWLVPSENAHSVDLLAEGIESIAQNRRLPIPVGVVARELHSSAGTVCAAIDRHPTIRRRLGVICEAHIGVRMRRAISLLRAMSRGTRGWIYPLNELANICIEGDPASAHSARDVAIVLSQHKHLFVNCFDSGWATTIPYDAFERSPPQRIPETMTSLPVSVDSPSSELFTNKQFLIRLLEDRGPMYMKDISEAFVAENPKEASRSSVGPTLLLNEEFVRLAPHVYALSNDWNSGRISANALDKVLLNEFQCAIYTQARWACEPMDLYPAWTYARELAWARWAISRGYTNLLNSLLSVVEPQVWPTNASDIHVWMDKKKHHGVYSLDDKLSVSLEETIPCFLEFLAASLWAQQQGHISWIGVNRTTGCRVNDRHAAATLALLIVHGIVESPSHWQMSHRFLAQGHVPIARMLDHVLAGNSGWPTDVCGAHTEMFQERRILGWLGDEDSANLLERYSSSTQALEIPEPVEVSGDDVLVALRARSRDKLIDSLM